MTSAERLDRTYLDAVSSVLDGVAETFRREPASFLYERDLQALLFGRLFDRLATSTLAWSGTELGLPGLARHPLRLNPVKTEYPSDQRFDLAVLAETPDRLFNAWNQPVRIGIELKLWQADLTGADFRTDREKLDRYRAKAREVPRPFAGVCVAFCHRPDDWRLKEWGTAAHRIERVGELSIPDDAVTALVVVPNGE